MLFFALPLLQADPVHLELSGQHLSLRTDGATLEEILRAFAHYGIEVVHPSLPEQRLTFDWRERPLGDALAELLGGFNHDTRWLSYPVGGGWMHTLTGLRIYGRETAQDPLRRMPPPTTRWVTLHDGGEAVADELLLGLTRDADIHEIRALLRALGGQVISVDEIAGIYRVRLPPNSNLPAVLEQVLRHPHIAAAEPNRAVRIPGPALPPASAAATAGAAAPRPAALPLADGPAALAIIDSGVNPDWLPERQLRATLDVTGQNRDRIDSLGHGTQMALLAAGQFLPQGSGSRDTAVPLVSIRGFDDEGRTSHFGILESLAFARDQGAAAISMSWGSPTPSPIMEAAFARMADQGMILIAAAGNEGRERVLYPAGYASVLAVAAATPDGTLWENSNRGDGIDLMAPGITTFPVGHQGPPGTYAGTSIATPVVAAAITLFRQQHPEATAAQIREALLASLSPAPEGQPGLFDAQAKARFLQTGLTTNQD